MNKENCVYLITNKINGKKYVGVAKNFDKRMYQHSISHDKGKSYIDNAIEKYGWENFESIIIDNYNTDEDRKKLEQKYIKELHTLREDGGYNLTKGGDTTIFPDTKGENNPRSQLLEKDIKEIRQRRMNGERLSTVFEDYKDRLTGDKRAGFSKIWLHLSWLNVCPDFIGKYPDVNTKYFASIKKNNLISKQYDYLKKYFKWFGPINCYNILYKNLKWDVDWESFQKICKNIVEELYGSKDKRRTLKQKEKVKKLNMQYRQEIKEEPIYS